MGRRTRAVGLVLAALLAVGLLSGCDGMSVNDMTQRVAGERAARGIPALQVDPGLSRKAQDWAEQLAATRSLRHSDLTVGVPDGWTSLAENVGSGTSTADMHARFMASTLHRANILEPRSNRVGIGVATGSDGRLYVVEEFGGY